MAFRYSMMSPRLDPQSLPRKLILLLDGTKKEYGDRTTNVFHLYSMLLSSSTQLTYYQPGIGSLEDASRLSKLTDAAFAFTLKKHLKAAYRFVIKNYDSSRKDKIYLFGYSRGAHTAHALADMISKVGLVPKDNVEQVDKAYELYTRTDEEGIRLCKRFKKINGISPEIEFMGLWDTVSSVGFASQRLPFTRENLHCKKFRHALSLDERRAFFRPDTFQDVAESPSSETRAPQLNRNKRSLSQVFLANGGPDPDILEMWFAGGHSDVGGGSQPSDYPYSHSRISLRWMVRECFRSQLGLEFRDDELRKLFLGNQALEFDMPSPDADPIPPDDLISAFEALDTVRIKNRSSKRNSRMQQDADSDDGEDMPFEVFLESPRSLDIRLAEVELRDSLMPIHDAMQKVFLWKLLGIRPRRPNDPILIHRSVRWRQDACKWVQHPGCHPRYKDIAKRLGVANYKPRAQFSESMVRWDDQLPPATAMTTPQLIPV